MQLRAIARSLAAETTGSNYSIVVPFFPFVSTHIESVLPFGETSFSSVRRWERAEQDEGGVVREIEPMNRAAGILAGCNNGELRRGVCTRVPKFHGEEGSVGLSTLVERIYFRSGVQRRFSRLSLSPLTVAMAPEKSLSQFRTVDPGTLWLYVFTTNY